VETALARKILAGDIRDGQTVVADVANGGLVFEAERSEVPASRI
jgi:hypothetical protein